MSEKPCCDSCADYPDEYYGSVELFAVASEKKKPPRPLNKPFRTPGGPKKFSVYVKNDKGNVVKVNFGDPNMEIKRDDPGRRKNFRARHNCDSPGPKWKARYWSCRFWEKGAPVGKLTSSEKQVANNTAFANIVTVALQRGKPGPNDPRKTPAKPSERRRGSKKNKPGSAEKPNKSIEMSGSTVDALKSRMEKHNKAGKGSKASLGMLKTVYRRGAGAFSTSHHPKMSRHGWAMARVAAFLYLLKNGKPSNPNYKQDNDLLPKGHPRKSS